MHDPRTPALIMAMYGGLMAVELAGDMNETKDIRKEKR
jgi:hypothetical protein